MARQVSCWCCYCLAAEANLSAGLQTSASTILGHPYGSEVISIQTFAQKELFFLYTSDMNLSSQDFTVRFYSPFFSWDRGEGGERRVWKEGSYMGFSSLFACLLLIHPAFLQNTGAKIGSGRRIQGTKKMYRNSPFCPICFVSFFYSEIQLFFC